MNATTAKLSKIHDECESCRGCGYNYKINENEDLTPIQCAECNGYGVHQKVDANGQGIPKVNISGSKDTLLRDALPLESKLVGKEIYEL